MIITYNSKFDINGNRRNLVINTETKQYFYYGGHVFDLGIVHDGCGIREIENMKKDYIAEGFTPVKHSQAWEWRKEEN